MRKDCCKHFTGVHRPPCDAGIDYDKFRRPGHSMLATMPCTNPNIRVCDKREYPTAKEIANYENEAQRAIAPILEIDKAVHEGRTEGVFNHHCGGQIKWARPKGCHLRGACDGCDWSVIE